jgi:hypothetical protein
MARRRRGRNEPVTLAVAATAAAPYITAAIGGITAILGTAWGQSEREEQLKSAQKAEKLRQIALEAERSRLLEEAAIAQQSAQAQEFAASKRREQIMVIGAVAGIGLLVAGTFLYKGFKKRG